MGQGVFIVPNFNQKKNKDCNQPQTKNQPSYSNNTLEPTPRSGNQFWQPDPFNSSAPKVSIEPTPYWQGRWSITIRQEDCVWRLLPCLRRTEAKQLLEVFREQTVSWQLDLNEGCPIEIIQINQLVEDFLNGGEAVA